MVRTVVAGIIGVIAVGAFAAAAVSSSPGFAFIGLAAAVVSLLIAARASTGSAHADSRPVRRPARDTGQKPSPRSGCHLRPAPAVSPDPRTAPAPREALRVTPPATLDIPGVAHAILETARTLGPAARVTVWRADGASGDAVSVGGVGVWRGEPAPGRRGIDTALAEGRTVSETIGLAEESAAAPRSGRRYVIPVTFTGVRGAAAIDFEDTSPDPSLLDDLARAFRLPLAAALALGRARQESEAARALLESARDLARLLDPERVVSVTLDRALEATAASTGSIMLYDEDGATLRIAAAVGLPRHVVRDTVVRPGDGIAGWVALSGQPLVVEDLPGRTDGNRSRSVRSAVSVPLSDEDGVLGVLNVGSRKYPSTFTATDLETLETLARQAAVSLRNARAIASAGELYFDTLKALSLALETKDPYALGGTERVVEYATRLGAAMGLGLEESRALEIAAMLHDIAMPAAGEAVMVSDRPLSTVERGMLKLHPVIAAEILEQAPALREVVPIVYHHHERYDGTGYAGGVGGEAIPLAARILAVADAYVAMTSDRPYRSALTEDAALEELRRHAGTQFDPTVVETFSTVVVESDRVR